MNVTVKTTSGISPGPYSLYYDIVDPLYLLVSNISSASLAAGYDVVVPDTATTLYVANTRTGCSNSEAIPLPPSTFIQFRDVQIRGRFFSNPGNAQTASVYYKIDTQPWDFLGRLTDDSCDTLPSVVVPQNSRLFLGVISGSLSVRFDATGSDYMCTPSPVVNTGSYCGIDTPYSQWITQNTTASIIVGTKVFGLATCGTPITPPPPPPPVFTASLSVEATNTTDIALAVLRYRYNGIDWIEEPLYILDDGTIPIPDVQFTYQTTPDVQPNDRIVARIVSQEPPPTQLFVAMEITQQVGSGDIVLYDTINYGGPGYVYVDEYAFQLDPDAQYTIRVRNAP